MRRWSWLVALALGVASVPPLASAQMDHGGMQMGPGTGQSGMQTGPGTGQGGMQMGPGTGQGGTAQGGANAGAGNVPTGQAAPAPPAQAAARLEVTTNPATVEPRQPADLTITLRNAATGAPLTDVQLEHQRLVHLIVVSDDLALFSHEHPTPAGDGTFRLTYTFPSAGPYHLYADFHSASLGPQALAAPLTVAGAAPAAAGLAPGATSVSANGAQVDFVADPAAPRVGQPAQLRFRLSQNGQPLSDLGPYLGVAGHLVAVSQDLQEFVHTHPSNAAMPAGMSGMGDMADMDHAHMTAAPPDARFGPEVSFTLTFRRPGLHKVWGQFSRDGDVIVAPFVVQVAP